MMIKHSPRFDIDKICQHYSEKDGVPVKYVCSSALNSGELSVDIFYRDTPHPEFGNRYFGLYEIYDSWEGGRVFICNADKVEEFEFGLVEDDNGNLRYSRHVHDYMMFNNGHMIDGGRAYIRSGMHPVYVYIVRDGEMMEKKDDEMDS